MAEKRKVDCRMLYTRQAIKDAFLQVKSRNIIQNAVEKLRYWRNRSPHHRGWRWP